MATSTTAPATALDQPATPRDLATINADIERVAKVLVQRPAGQPIDPTLDAFVQSLAEEANRRRALDVEAA